MAVADHPFGMWNKWAAFFDPGIRGFLSRQIGTSTPTYVTTAGGVDGPYSARNIPERVYGNIDWRGTLNDTLRIITWTGPTFRYTNAFLPASVIVIGDTPAPIYARGRILATAPLPLAGAALKVISGVEWIRVICWQPSTEEWVAFEKVRDNEPANFTNWTEVGRVAWSTVSEPEPIAGDLRKQNQFEMHAYFNSTATQAIGTWIGYVTNAVSLLKQPATFLMDFDWPSSSGGPVVISSVAANTIDRFSVVTSAVSGSVEYTTTTSGVAVVARDFDFNDTEVQVTVTGSGVLSVKQVVVPATSETLTVTRTQAITLADSSGHTLSLIGGELITGGSKVTDLTIGSTPVSASGTREEFRGSVAGFDLRSGYFSGFQEHRTEVTSGSTVILPTATDKTFDHTSFFTSSLGTINHVSAAKPTVPGTIPFSLYLVSFFIGIPAPGLNSAINMLPRVCITGRETGGGAFRGGASGPNQGNLNKYQFDSFGNELVYADYSTNIYFISIDFEPNPALPDENLLSGDNLQTLHDVAFVMDQVSIA